MLHHVKIEGYKSIAECDLALTPLNIVIGANGAGKSNFISAFRFLERLLTKNLQGTVGKSGGADRLLHHGEKHTPEMLMKFEFEQNAYQMILMGAQGGGLMFKHEITSFHDHKYSRPYSESLGEGHAETKLHQDNQPATKIAGYVLAEVKNWTIYHFHDTSDTSPLKKSNAVEDNQYLRPYGENLAAFLYWVQLKHPAAYQHIVEHIQLVTPFFADFDLAPSRLNENNIKLEWKQKDSDAYFDGDALSDGTLRFICLATVLLQPKLPALILLDEPELGLHPFALKVLAELIESASQRTQIILATQSVTLLNQFSLDFPKANEGTAHTQVIIAHHDGMKTELSSLTEANLSAWIEDYSLGEIWEKNIIGGRP